MQQRAVFQLVLITGLLASSTPAFSSECCFADVTEDGQVNIDEVLQVIFGWGSCPSQPEPCPMDIDQSGSVDVGDLQVVLDSWGSCNPHDHMDPCSGEFIDITCWGNFHDSNDNSHHDELVGGRTAITTEAMAAYNHLRAFLELPALTYEEVGQWAFDEALTNNSQAWGDDLKGVGLYYAMQVQRSAGLRMRPMTHKS